ncbi:MAG: hypothetical protein IKN81_03465 [Oscillospiraceae bacterium]|nr:hypothetical protein [Oscillospiraceae bacterium]
METRITTRAEFIQRYWKYYLMLEDNFRSVEQYLAIDEINFNAFSNEYIKQYQAICSEIDVISKSFCKEIGNNFAGSSINAYCKCIIDNKPDFEGRVIKIKDRALQVTPWKSWSYTTKTQNGRTIVDSVNPDWWQKYNKIKHNRTTINSETGLPYYKLANQKNVLSALAGLFQIEMYYYKLLWEKYFHAEPDMPNPPSNLFEIENWGNIWVTFGPNIAFQPTGA